ncbi:MAG: ParB/RepB/Spo0J family partition protein [Candidatus Pacebacteria bacterium]|nr:ParB/RepB/Spo0J family partition protein [Candidatus Paceibacterota bacterium]
MEERQLNPVFHIETDKIKPNPFQPRRNFDEAALNELANSIREFGILHPLVVTKVETHTETGTQVEYQLIAGERRLMAAKIAGLERVPAIIKAMPNDRERLELAIIENIQRENLNPIETARAYAKLQDQFGMTQREVAARLGKSREVVANALRLLNLPSHIQESVSQGHINESQARLLLMVTDLKEQQKIFDELIHSNLSVRELRGRIKSSSGEAAPTAAAPVVDPEIHHIEEQLEEVLGTKVKVQKEGEGGKLTINFYSKEELAGILQKLIKEKEEVKTEESQEPKEEFTV